MANIFKVKQRDAEKQFFFQKYYVTSDCRIIFITKQRTWVTDILIFIKKVKPVNDPLLAELRFQEKLRKTTALKEIK